MQIFGNEIKSSTYKKGERSKSGFIKKFGDDSDKVYSLQTKSNSVIGPAIGVEELITGEGGKTINPENGLIVGNIRMGFGHYRISMAIASAANHMGYTPYWLDLHAYKETTGGKVISHLNKLYSLGSRLSQKFTLFNKLYWEPLNSEGFRKLSYNAVDQKVSELMTPVLKSIPKDMPYIATHVWPAQAAVHAGFSKVINVIPDNWPMALHLAEGSIHTVQTPSSYWGYRTLNGMSKGVCKPMPSETIVETGHYIDHELVTNLEDDTLKRIERTRDGEKLRLLLTVGGAGAQQLTFKKIIRQLIPYIKKSKVTLFINVGDHKGVMDELTADIPEMKDLVSLHMDNWEETKTFSEDAIQGEVSGIHMFYHQDIYAAVYSTNVLMRVSDLLITKPSELAFYPIPKLMIKRVGGHEAWGAVRAAEIGDGSIECDTDEKISQMLTLLLEDRYSLRMMNSYILKNHKIGIYNGAYKVIELIKGADSE